MVGTRLRGLLGGNCAIDTAMRGPSVRSGSLSAQAATIRARPQEAPMRLA